MRRMQTVGAKSGAIQTSKTVPSPAEWQTECLAGPSVHCYLEGAGQKSGAVAHTNSLRRCSAIMGKSGRATLRRRQLDCNGAQLMERQLVMGGLFFIDPTGTESTTVRTMQILC